MFHFLPYKLLWGLLGHKICTCTHENYLSILEKSLAGDLWGKIRVSFADVSSNSVLLIGAVAWNRALWWDGVSVWSCLLPLGFVLLLPLNWMVVCWFFVVTVVCLIHYFNICTELCQVLFGLSMLSNVQVSYSGWSIFTIYYVIGYGGKVSMMLYDTLFALQIHFEKFQVCFLSSFYSLFLFSSLY